ncbi:hypothetical protein [Streptomyces sp. SID2999]|nr:hypothetical protein [Streptomyces sp. SID2999]
MTSDEGSVRAGLDEDAFPVLSEEQMNRIREYGNADALEQGQIL